MARGYLGKISAVISANTAGYRRGINEAAQDTRNFARAVEQSLRSASTDAAKSLRSILTPIQQVQASLAAAGQQGLSFRGFRGAIRDIQELKQRLTSLTDQDTRLVLRITGADRLTDLQQQLREISNRDVQVVTRVGGLGGIAAGIQRINEAREALAGDDTFRVLQSRIAGATARVDELREKLQFQVSLAGGSGDLGEATRLRTEFDLLTKSLTELEQERRRIVSQRVGLNIDFTELDELANRIRGVNLAALPDVMEQLTQSQFTQAEASMMRMVNISEGLSKPLAAAVSEFGRLDLAVQAAFLPTLSRVQNEVQELEVRARETGDGFEDSFNRIEARADGVINSIRQLSELAKSVAGLSTGEELSFQQPELVGALGRARLFQDKAAPLMEGASPQVRQETVDRLRQILELSQQAERQLAALRAAPRGFVADNIAADLRATAQQIDGIVSEGRAALRIASDTAATSGKTLRDEMEAASESIAPTDPITIFKRSVQEARQEIAKLNNEAQRAAGERNIARIAAFVRRRAGSSDALRRATEAATGQRDEAAGINQQDARVKSLRDEMRSISESIVPTDPIAVFKRTIQEARQEIAKLKNEAQRAAGERNIERIARFVGRNAGDEDALRRATAAAGGQRDEAGGINRSARPNADLGLGTDIASQQRAFDNLRGSITSAKSQIDSLPAGLRAQFIPAIQGAEAEYRRLFNTAGVTTQEIQDAAGRLATVEQGISRAANAARQFGGTFAQFRDSIDGRSAAAGLEFLRTALSRATGDATRAAAAVDELAEAYMEAANAPGGFQQNAAQLRRIANEAIKAVSSVDGVGQSVNRLTRGFSRAGDVSRGAFGNTGLAIQQAIFAFDDFFSVTGGLDQRIRAAGNNISQLGFILGGTAGLIGGVLVSALAQAAAGLVKWASSGAGSVEIAKALNERLERQKSLLGEITSGFNELADGVGENAFSEASRRAADFEARLTSVIDKLKEFRDSAATALNADVFMAEGVVESRQGRLREAGTLPLAAARQALLRDAERSAEQARVRARSAPAMSRQELQDAFGGGYTAPAGATNEMLRGTLEERQSDLARVVDSWFYTFIEPFEQANARRQIVIVSRARDNLVAAIASNIEQITRGVVGPAARRFDATANRAGEMLGRANEVGGPSGDVTAARDALEGDTRAFRDALTRLGKAAAAGRETEVQSLAKFLEALSLSVVAREREARALLAAANASARFVEVLGRLREANDAIFGDISNVASQARRDALQAAGSADSGLSRRSDADFAQARSDRLQQELRAAEDRRTAAESALRDAERRFRFESPDPSIRQLVNEAASLRSIIESPQTAPQAAASARQRELFVNDQLDRAFASSPMGRALQDQVDEAARAAGSVLARDSMITRGRELSMTPGQQAARELEGSLRSINAFFDDEVQRLGFPFQGREEIDAQRQEAIRREVESRARAAAPGLFSLADSVQNAMLQGPSRAALVGTDVSTSEGQRELYRLMRGDDPSKDENLVELRKQSEALNKLVEAAEEEAKARGIVLDFN